MWPKNTGQRKRKYIIYALSAAIHIKRIAAFFISTKNALFSPFSVYNEALCAPAFMQVLFLVPGYSERTGSGYPRCRSPPSDFDFAHSKNRNWRITHERNKSAGILPVLYK